MISKLSTSVAALALLVGAPLQAEQASAFNSIDADANGYISPQEAESNSDLTARWNELDADKNNLLDSSEFSAFEMGESMGSEGEAPASMPAQ